MLILEETIQDPFGYGHVETRALVSHDDHVTIVLESQEDLNLIRQSIRKNDVIAMCGSGKNYYFVGTASKYILKD